MDKANELVARWLKEGKTPGPLAADVAARLSAAVDVARGQGYDMGTERIDERWLEPLTTAAMFFARHESHASVAERIVQYRRFQQTDQCRRVRKWAVKTLTTQFDELTVAEIQRMINWISENDPPVEKKVWKQIADGLQRRWVAAKDPELRNRLAGPLLYILRHQSNDRELLLDFLRLQVQKHRGRNSYTQLFDALLGEPWSQETEDEAFAILAGQSYAAPADDQLRIQVAALYRLTDRMVPAHFNALMKKVEHQEKLDRIELRDIRKENLKTAREDFAERLQNEIPKQPEALRPWLKIERLYLDVQMNRDLDRVEAACWEFLGPEPRKLDADADADADTQRLLDEVLAQRYLITAANLATRKDAKEELIDRLFKYLDRGIAAGKKANEKDDRWKLMKYQMLIALDRPDTLVKTLQEWIRPEDANNFWRLSLDRILAERGEIAKAIELFEKVEAADELGPAEYRTLADWYMILDDRAAYDGARIAAYKFMQEYQLSNWLAAKLRPWHSDKGRLPDEFDENVLLVFAALFEKSGHPQNYLGYLQQFYEVTHEFRLLADLPDAGHRTHGRKSLSVPRPHGVGALGSPQRGHRRVDHGAPGRGPPASENGRRPSGARSAGTAGRTPLGRGDQPAWSARREGAGGHAKGLRTEVESRRAAADGRFPRRTG